MISIHDFADKILSCDSDYVLDVVVWLRFGNFTISLRRIILTSMS